MTNKKGNINSNETFDFEIGEWVLGEKGFGQLIYIRQFHVESFMELASYVEVDDSGVYNELFGIKLFCDFNWKVTKKHPVYFSHGIRKLKKSEMTKIELLKNRRREEYLKYIIYDEKDYSDYAFALQYLVDDQSSVDYEDLIDEVCFNLMPCFTFKEFKKECKKIGLGINVMDYLKNGAATKVDGMKLITIAFYSRKYSVVNKESIFTGVRAIV